MARVFAAMSGGVDSTVAAALLVREGHDVVGITMRLLGDDAPGGCCPSGSVRDAKVACARIGIPHYTWDMRDVFEREVTRPFVDEYARGHTPNPCIACNDRVKFSALLQRVAREGGEALATGHYARIVAGRHGPRLARGVDAAKDQSYFLYRCSPDQLSRLMFPVGAMAKDDVRAYAADLDLPCARAPESQDVCFVPGGDTKGFLRGRIGAGERPVEVVDTAGEVLGRLETCVGLTVGERLSPGGGGGGRRYVVEIDAQRGRVVVGGVDELQVKEVIAASPVWWAAEDVMDGLTARVRYRGPGVRAKAGLRGEHVLVEVDEPVSGVAPGQSVVLWDGDIVIGGGVIEGAA